MDPQKLSQLDPKLREAYQRVMGTVIPDPQAPSAPTQTPPPAGQPASDTTPTTPTAPTEPVQTPNPEPQPEPATPASIPEPTTPPQAPGDQQPTPFPMPQPAVPAPATEAPAPTQQTSSNFVQMNSEVAAAPAAPTTNFSNFAAPASTPQAQTMTVKKKSGIMPILFGLVAVVFLVIYTLFWTKIFNFKLPFLP